MKKINLILCLLFNCLFLISLASAEVSWSMPSNIQTNSNFDININGNGLYSIEINIPSGFVIVSDQSNGILIDGIYRTSYASNLKITARAPAIAASYIISGAYTDGNGVKSFNNQTIIVYALNSNSIPTCPQCKENGSWSNCINNKQARLIYKCSPATNYACESSIEEMNCNTNALNSSIPSSANNTNEKNIFVSSYNSIINFFKKIIDFLIFWREK